MSGFLFRHIENVTYSVQHMQNIKEKCFIDHFFFIAAYL